MRFYNYGQDGNIITFLKDSEAGSDEQMKELLPNTTDAAVEKHLPVAEVDGQKVSVKVGSAEHAMTEKHFIEWIALTSKQGKQIKELTPDQAPEAEFVVCKEDTPLAVYAYCNLHGVWKIDL